MKIVNKKIFLINSPDDYDYLIEGNTVNILGDTYLVEKRYQRGNQNDDCEYCDFYKKHGRCISSTITLFSRKKSLYSPCLQRPIIFKKV